MATTVRSIVNRAAALLNDEEYVRWEESELLEWLNDGQREIAKGPATDVYVLRDNISAVAGTVQELPSNGLRLIDVVRDVSSGSAILQSDYATVDILQATWREATAGTAENYFYDERNPTQFELYPPQAGGEPIEIVYNAQPGDATMSGNIVISDMFAAPLIDYIVYRGLSKDTEDGSPEMNRAMVFYRTFLAGAGYKDAVDAVVEPERS